MRVHKGNNKGEEKVETNQNGYGDQGNLRRFPHADIISALKILSNGKRSRKKADQIAARLFLPLIDIFCQECHGTPEDDKMQTMNISLPDPMKQYVEEQVVAGAYSSASEYVRELVRTDQKRQAKEILERTLIAAMNEGTPIEANDEWWATLRADFRKRSAARRT